MESTAPGLLRRQKLLIPLFHQIVCNQKLFISSSLEFMLRWLCLSGTNLFSSLTTVLKISTKANDLCKWFSTFTYLIGNTLANFEDHLSVTSSVSPHTQTHTHYWCEDCHRLNPYLHMCNPNPSHYPSWPLNSPWRLRQTKGPNSVIKILLVGRHYVASTRTHAHSSPSLLDILISFERSNCSGRRLNMEVFQLLRMSGFRQNMPHTGRDWWT